MEKVSIQSALDALNAALIADQAAMEALINFRVPCNESLADHPSVVCTGSPGGQTIVGALGLLNGVLEPLTGLRVAIVENDKGDIMAFQAFDPNPPQAQP